MTPEEKAAAIQGLESEIARLKADRDAIRKDLAAHKTTPA